MQAGEGHRRHPGQEQELLNYCSLTNTDYFVPHAGRRRTPLSFWARSRSSLHVVPIRSLLCRQEKDTAVILGKEQERLKEEADMAAAAAQRMEQVLAAVGRAQSEPLRCGTGDAAWTACLAIDSGEWG